MLVEEITQYCKDHARLIRIIIIAAISLFGLLLRINVAVYGPIEHDEKTYIKAAALYSQAIRSGQFGEIIDTQFNYEHPIFYKLVYGTLMSASSPMDISDLTLDIQITNLPFFKFIRILALRSVSVLFGVLAIIALSLINPWAGLFLALQTFAIKYTSVVYLEALPSCLSILSTMAFLRCLNHLKFPTHHTETFQQNRLIPSRALAWLILSAAAAGIAVASKYIYGVVGLAITIYAFYLGIKKRPKLWVVIGIWAAIAGLSFILADPVLWNNPIEQLQKSFCFSLNYSTSDRSRRG